MSSEKRKTILLVEDEAIIAIAQKKTLEKYGYKVITANNDERAINVFRENDDIDLILMDIDLGKSIDGTETAKRILAEHNLPVVFLSSHTEPEIVEKTEKITSYGYVVKNSGITVLDASIKMAFKLFDANKQIVESEIKQKAMISNISDVIAIIGADGIMKYKSPNIEKLFGWKPEDLIGTDGFSTVHPDDLDRIRKVFFDVLKTENSSRTVEYRYKCKDGSFKYIELTATNLTGDPAVSGILLNYHDISERRILEATLEKRLIALTRPLDQPENIVFDDLFDSEVIQRIQDEFAMATGVASIITKPDGTPITRPSNFSRLCNDIIRCTEKGKLNCYNSDAIIGRYHPEGPIIQPCLSGGLWDAGASITVGEKHIANWLIGQVRDDTQSEEKIRDYARTIGADEKSVIEAFHEIKTMPVEQFKNIAQALYTLANQLSESAYQNVQQARFITERKKIDEALRDSEERFRKIFEEGQFGTGIVNKDFIFENVNNAFCRFIGYSQVELLKMTFMDIIHPDHLADSMENIQKLKKGEITSYQTEKKYIRKNGDICWGNNVVSAVYNANGEFLYFLAIIIDITERKSAEDALRISEGIKAGLFDKLNEAQHIAKIGSWDWDLKADKIWWSDETFRIFGVHPEEFTPGFEENVKFIHPDDIKRYGELFEHSFKTGEPLDCTFRLISGDGVNKYCNTKGKLHYDSIGQPLHFIGTIHDVSESRRAEIELTLKNEELEALNEELNAAIEEMEATNEELLRINNELSARDEKIKQTLDILHDREARLRTLLQTIPDLVWLKDKDGVYLSCNKQFERFFGTRETEIIGRTDYDFMDSELADFFRGHDRRAMEAGISLINEEWITYADDGHRAYLETIKTPMFDEKGTLIGVLGIGRDITARKQARENLLKAEERYFKAQSMGHVGNWEYNLQTANFWGSDEAKRIYGFDSEQFDFTTDEVESCIPERERVHQALIDLIENGKDYNLEFEIHPRNGDEPRIIWSVAELQRDEKGDPFIVTGVIQDITNRKRFENELKTKNEELTAAIEEMEAANEELLAVSEDLLAKEKALIGEKKFIEALLECIPGYLYVYDDKGSLIRWNKKHEEMTGYSAEELSHMNMSDWFEGEDAVRVAAAVDEVFRTGYGEVEANLIIKGGRKLLIHSNGVRLIIDGKNYFTGVGTDVTERRRLEEELIQSKLTLEAMLQTMVDGMVTADLSGRITYSNKAAGKILSIGKDVLGKDYKSREWRQLDENGDPYPLEQLPLAVAMREQREVLNVEHQIEASDGERKWLSVNAAPLFDEAGKLSGGVASFRDITENKRLVEELKKNERRFEQLIKNSSDTIVILDADGIQLYVSDVVERILGYKPEEVTNIPVIQEMIHPEDIEKTQAAFLEIISKGHGGVEYRHKHKKGGWVYLEAWGTNQLDNPDIRGVVLNVRDITRRKCAEEEIQLDEARLESLLKINQHPAESIQDLLDFVLNEAIVLTESKIGYIYFYDENKKEFVLNTWSKEVMQQCAVVEKQTIYHLEKTGLWGEAVRQRCPIMVNDFNAPNPLRKGLPEGHNPLKKFLTIPVVSNEHIVAVVGVANKEIDYNDSDIRQLNLMMDAVWKIVQRKKAEENVQKLLREKELLLQEVHHRIKNNMNTIKSLLNLQADAQENPEIANVLFDAENRVISMMVLYDRLYRSDDYRIISIKDYIPALAHEIISNFPSGKKVKIIKKLDDFVLDVKILQPLGIIINELLTNIMKYAFTDREDGIITISSDIKGSHVSIIIHDNGVGIPESIEIENSTGFGMKLVGMLTEQIGGSISIERGEGTKFILEFDV